MYGITRRHGLWAAITVALAAALVLTTSAWASGSGWTTATGRYCAYSQHSVSRLANLGHLVGHDYDCSMLFNDEATSWDNWSHPWFTTSKGDQDWVSWKKADPNRRVVISPGFVPENAPPDWRSRAAAGEYDSYFTALGVELVKAGMGDSVIRLAHEGNGNWQRYWFGDTGAAQRQWVAGWRHAALAMKAVPNSSFVFDWNVAAGFDNVPLDWYYPGDDVVDIIGFDFYDLDQMTAGAPSGDLARWDQEYARANGPAVMIAFAAAHHKPISIPEWGLVPMDRPAAPGGGDNPQFVDGISTILANNKVSYSGYFDDDVTGTRLPIGDAPRALEAYRHQLSLRHRE
jgi:hypothetical protein